MDGASALYAGEVMHVRLKPRRHRLAYRLFSLLLDLDEIDTNLFQASHPIPMLLLTTALASPVVVFNKTW